MGPDSGKKHKILCVMQRAEYLEAMLLYTCLECLMNFELASELLIRVQQYETDQRMDLADCKHSPLLGSLMELEEELQAFADNYGENKAMKRGEGITSFDIVGPLSKTPEALMTNLFSISESVQALLRSIGQALKGPSKDNGNG